MKTDAQLRKAARAAGILTEWQDVHGKTRAVGHETLRALLEVLGGEARSTAVPLVTAEAGATYTVPGLSVKARAPEAPGYHLIRKGKRRFTLAVAPARQQGRGEPRGWGLSVQLYALYRKGDGGIGTYGALRDFMRGSAEAGASAVAVSPLHAQFSADPWRFSPYSPSSRLWMNAVHIDVGEAAALLDLKPPKLAPRQGAGGDALIAWPEASRAKLKALRGLFDAARGAGCFEGGHPSARSLAAFRKAGGAALMAHATFEALHAHFFGRDRALWNWGNWPAELRDPDSAAVRRFAGQNREAVEFHLFLQWLAARQFKSAAEAAARDGRMARGIIKDIAVGADGGGSEAWSNQGRMLSGASIGAPPDAFNTLGQNWGVTTFSPAALAATGYAAFVQLLRSALADSGGIRIDHVLGLRRLWVVPNGADARDGAYIRYPLTDLLRLTALEAHRAGAVVLGEDLGTVPDGFREALDGYGIKGMQVLWFERQGQGFLPPQKWRKRAVGMTTTHDLPTVAGWWLGKDIVWRKRLKLFAKRDGAARAATERRRDRAQLWSAFLKAGVATGVQPRTHDVSQVLAGAIDYLGLTACDLVVLPLEDALGRKEQPNLPGTVTEHPNWRRRILVEAGAICRQKQVAARLRRLAASRSMGRGKP
ncbi:4-alpha-glucanotransferase [Dongia sp. agr-C8]